MTKNYQNIKIKYFNDKCKIEQVKGSDWIDLRSAITTEIDKGEAMRIPLGVAIELPPNHEAHMIPRSSTLKSFGIIMANGLGLFDESYCGNNDQWVFNAIAHRDTMVVEGDRIAQFRIVEKQPKITFTEVEELDNPDRNGHGSTGIS